LTGVSLKVGVAAPEERIVTSSWRNSWLCPTELDRSRVVDASPGVRNVRLLGSAFIGLALLAAAPWVGWWVLILFVLAAANLVTVERRLSHSRCPERVSAWAMVGTLLIIALGVAFSGGPRSPALPWMVIPAATVATRFRPAVVAVGLAITVVAILAVTLGVDPGGTVRYPVYAFATLALLGSVTTVVWTLQGAELRHRDEAVLDPLTGLLNRQTLQPRFVEIAEQARITGEPVCLVLCDIDGFKQINDRHGHDRGDAALREVAYELRKRLRSFELVYRLGGDEFLIVLPGVDAREGVELGERLRVAVAQARPSGFAITMSFGVSAERGEGVAYETLFKAADEALYAAKRGGRNRVELAGAVMHDATPRRGVEREEAISSFGVSVA
jgi:diguanylate cyclase (GGDEF)-like protein